MIERSPLLAMRAALAVAVARLRAQPLRPLLVVVGVALAFAMLVAVFGGSLVARQQALTRELAATPASERAFRVDRFGLPLGAADYRRADRGVRRAIAPLSHGRARRVVFFRELRVAGQLVELAGVDNLADVIRLRGGRLPHACTVTRCEMLQVGGGRRSAWSEGGLHLVRVGVAELRDPTLFGSLSATSGAGLTHATVLIAPSVNALQRLDAISSFYRIYSWLLPLQVERLRTWDIDELLRAESRAQAALEATNSAFRLGGPDTALTDAAGRGKIAARRLVLVGGETSALLLGFALIAAIGLRRGLVSERRRLLARGARPWQLVTAAVAELVTLAVVGTIVGSAAGALATAFLARRAGFAAGPILTHALLTPIAVGALIAACVAASACLFLATVVVVGGERRGGLGLIDVGALGAAATVAVAVSRGTLDSQGVSSSAVLLLLLPGLIAFVAAVLLGRLLTPAMRLAERLTRERALSLRLATLALARAPARTVVSCAFVAVALGLALFAASYRATLARGASDQAAFKVPLDYLLSEGPRLVMPLDAAPLARYRALAPQTAAYPALRLAATTPGVGDAVLSPTALGLPEGAIRRLRWRRDFSPLKPPEIARRLAPHGEPHPASVRVGAGAATLTARLRGADVVVSLVVADTRGRTLFIDLGRLRPGDNRLQAHIGAGLSLRALQIRLPADEQFFLAHRETESNVAAPPHGVLVLTRLDVAGRVVDVRGWSSSGAEVNGHGAAVRLAFDFADHGAGIVFRPRQATDSRAVPAVVSPEIARASGGVGRDFTLDFEDVTVRAHVVGVAARMPTVPAASGPFVLADRGWLETAIDAEAPGRGEANEVWLATSGGHAAFHGAPFAGLAVSSRSEIEEQLAADPLARATARTLAAAAAVALVLAILGFWVGVLSVLRDERSDFFDLEAQGVSPPELRAQLRTRAVILVAAGLGGGIALGVVLAQLVVALVRVSATTAVPEPPLRFDPAWLVCGSSVTGLALAALLVAEGTALAAFRSRRPDRASSSLE